MASAIAAPTSSITGISSVINTRSKQRSATEMPLYSPVPNTAGASTTDLSPPLSKNPSDSDYRHLGEAPLRCLPPACAPRSDISSDDRKISDA
jgi:hypothetical protein